MSVKRLSLPAIALLLVTVVSGGCGSDDANGEIQRKLDEFEGELGFDILAPDYLPPGTSRTPRLLSVSPYDGVVYLFDSSADANRPLAESPLVQISQFLSNGASPELPSGWPIPTPTDEDTVINGNAVRIRRNEFARESSVNFFTTYQGFDLVIAVVWYDPEREQAIELTGAMEEEAFKVAESLLN
jgi:hypothetical protein